MTGKNIRYFFCALITSCFLSACGSKEEETAQYQWVYKAQETVLPDGEAAIRQTGMLEESPQNIRCWLQLAVGNRACQIMQLQYYDSTDLNYDNTAIESDIQKSDQFYLQQWNAERGAWDSSQIITSEWFPEYEDYITLLPEKMAAGREGELCCVFALAGEYYLGVWKGDSKEILGKLPEDFAGLGEMEAGGDSGFFVSDEGKLYFYARNASVIFEMSRELQVTARYPVQGSVMGILEDPSEHKIYWYGYDDRGAGVWTLEGKALLEGLEMFDAANFLAVFSSEGELYLSDPQSLWIKRNDGDPEQVWKWREQGYDLERMTGLSAGETGEIFLWTYYEGCDQLVTIRKDWEISQEKQEVVLALTEERSQSALGQLIDSFNRQSPYTRVIVRGREKEESYSDYIQRVQMEISAERGPDMLSSEIFDMDEYAKNGYVLSLEGKLEGVDGLLPAALDCGRYGGEVYGVPYNVYLSVLVCSRELAGERSSWSVEEMMEAVEGSGASILHGGFTGSDIVYWFGLFDQDNRDYIDWENGESHLREEAFLRLLEFARKYQDSGTYNAQATDVYLRNGTIATAYGNMADTSVENFLHRSGLFQDGVAYIGLPKAEGKGVYLRSDCIYVNSASDKAEACIEFLNYLLSEEAQRKMSQYKMSSVKQPQVGESLESSAPFNIRTKFLEEQIQNSVQREELTQEQGEILYQMLINAAPWNSPADQIFFIVSEELEPYFAGSRTAREAVEKLDNRVQLYLDERK